MPLLSNITLNRRITPFLLLVLVLIGTFFVYQRGLSGAFAFDDGPNIANNAYIKISDLSLDTLRQVALSGASGPLRRPLSTLSFAFNYYLTGLDPFYFKATNLVIHLLNGVGLFALSTLLLNAYRKRFQPDLSANYAYWVSLAVAAAWLLHPFNLTSVLYVVQRMTSLSALFSIWGLSLFLWGRIRLIEGKSGVWAILLSLLLFTPLSALGKENGALLPLLMFVTEVSLFNFKTASAASRRFIIALFAITVAIPTAALLGYVAANPTWITDPYLARPFTLSERLMTEARVLWFYMRLIVLPANAQMGLFHDDIVNSQGLLQPYTTLLSIAGLVALLGFALLSRKKAPLVTFGVLFFLAGHLLESTVFSLEIAHEHRNYLPMYGLILIVFFYLLYPFSFKANLRLRQGVAILLVGLFAFNTFARAGKWSNPFELAENEVAHHPNSARSNGQMAAIYAEIQTSDRNLAEMNYLHARYHYEKAVSLSPSYTNGLFGLIILSSARGKNVEAEWIDMLEQRLKHAVYASDNGDQLLGLVTCQSTGPCKLAKADIERLLQAPFKNAALSGSNRALASSAWVYYLVNVVSDYPAALAAMQQAIEAAPNELEYRLTLAKFLIALQRNDDAKSQLADLRRLDKMGAYAIQIETQAALLDEQTKEHVGP